ncbi:MAG: dihydrodipicolinate synthetase [Chthonomonadales bacterium]|nr:dihydrodipicolinate synthetase [Chthonomonadales bacterium]
MATTERSDSLAGRELREHLRLGQVIPAHPLALTEARRLDERYQRALTRYYVDSGAGGIAVGVHTTQFEIRQPQHSLYRPVLELASETADAALQANPRPFVKVAGLIGPTAQAVAEAELALSLGYHCGLLSLGAWSDADDAALLAHCRTVAETIPLFGFYLQPAVGGRILSYNFWREFAEIENVVAIKIAPFNRYQTLDVIRAVADSGRDISLYTGNDDNIVIDLLTRFPLNPGGSHIRIAGGLLGQWAVWTHRAVKMLKEVTEERDSYKLSREMLPLAVQLTDANSAIFDAANGFAGCIAGIHEILRRQGLLRGIWCLNPHETLSPGQSDELDRILKLYPHLTDDAFVAIHRDRWLG